GLAQYDTSRSMRTWLYAIAVNCFRDFVRRQGSRPRGVPLTEQDFDYTSDAPQPHDVMLSREEQQIVQFKVMELHPDYRMPVILYYMRGVPQSEIAEILGLPLSVVKNRLYRARKRLRTALG